MNGFEKQKRILLRYYFPYFGDIIKREANYKLFKKFTQCIFLNFLIFENF
jgi:hypothetical protein